jgi:hypothetical protein
MYAQEPVQQQPLADQTLVEVVFSHPGSLGLRFAERVSDGDGRRWLLVENIAEGTQAAMVPQLHNGMVVHSVGDQFIDALPSQTAIELMKQRPVKLRFWPVPAGAPEPAAGEYQSVANQSVVGMPTGGGLRTTSAMSHTSGYPPQDQFQALQGMQSQLDQLRNELGGVHRELVASQGELMAERAKSSSLERTVEKLQAEQKELHEMNDAMTEELAQSLVAGRDYASPERVPAAPPGGHVTPGGHMRAPAPLGYSDRPASPSRAERRACGDRNSRCAVQNRQSLRQTCALNSLAGAGGRRCKRRPGPARLHKRLITSRLFCAGPKPPDDKSCACAAAEFTSDNPC